MARTTCPHCYTASDWIDQLSTKCPECIQPEEIERAKFLNRQTEEGVVAYLRAKRAKADEKEKMRR